MSDQKTTGPQVAPKNYITKAEVLREVIAVIQTLRPHSRPGGPPDYNTAIKHVLSTLRMMLDEVQPHDFVEDSMGNCKLCGDGIEDAQHG